MTTVGVLEQTPFVKNSAVERTAFNRGDYAADARAIQGFAAGARKEVTYFNQVAPAAGNRTNTIDTSTIRSLTQTSYTCVQNLELIFPEATLSFDWDADLTEASVTGVALVYPVVTPLIADQFLYPIGDGRLGIFQVAAVKPLSMRSGRFHQIDFYLTRIADDAAVQLLLDAASKTVIFDKPLNVGAGLPVMLEQESWRTLQQLRQMREVMGRHYFASFYNREVGSYCRPDGLYDPYVVRFVNTKIPFSLIACRPNQLQPDIEASYPMTIWGRFADRMTLSLDGLYTHHLKRVQVNGYLDVGITPLINRLFIAACDPPADDSDVSAIYLGTYVFSEAFYAGGEDLTALEALVTEAVMTRRLTDHAALLTNHVNRYRQGTPLEQFYNIPVYLYLIDVALSGYIQPV